MAALSAAGVAANLAEVRERIAAAAARSGRSPAEEVAVLAAVKYVTAADMGVLAAAGIELVGENRAQDLVEKAELYGSRFRWHFIGQLQSRKVKLVAPRVELIHSVATASAMRQLGREARPGLSVLIEVNVAGEPGKAGVGAGELDALLAVAPVPVTGLMTMPPATGGRAGENRRWFAALRELAAERGLTELSMGTSQDYEIAVEEGATIVRIGASLLG